MIEYVFPTNINDRVLVKAARVLEGGGLAALPTDVSWNLVCSLKSPTGIKKLRKLSGERDERHFTLLCSDISQFGELCSLDNTRFRLIKRLSPGPYVFILKTLSGTEKALDIRRREVGVRIPGHPVPLALINTLGHPLYSITAKKSMQDDCMRGVHTPPIRKYVPRDKYLTKTTTPSLRGEVVDMEFFHTAGDVADISEMPPIPEEDLFEGGWELEGIEGVDLVIDDGEERERVFSTILDISGDEIELLRRGAGAWPA